MANAFDREIINTLEKPLSSDVNLIGSYGDFALRSLVAQLMAVASSNSGGDTLQGLGNGFLNDGFKVRPQSPGMFVTVAPGVGFASAPGDIVSAVGGVGGLDDLAPYKPMVLTALQTIPIDAAPGSGTRCDIIEVAYDRQSVDSTSRLVLNPSTQQFALGTVNKRLSWALDGNIGRVTSGAASTAAIGYKVGDSSGNPPLVTSGYHKIADIVVPASTIVLNTANIRDERHILAPGGSFSIDGLIEVPATAAGTVSTMALQTNATPGVEVYLVCAGGGSGVVGAQATLVVLAGRPNQIASGVANITQIPFLAGWANNQIVATPALILRIDSGLQTSLQGTACYPGPRQVPLGAGCVVFSLGAVHFNSDGTQNYSGLPSTVGYNFHLSITPGAIAEIPY